MKRKHVTLKLLWEEYQKEQPKGYSLTQFRFHYNQNAKAQSPSTILSDMYVGGEKLFIDFAGDRMQHVDIETGEIISVQMFVACLPASDYGYALGVPSQKSEDFIFAIASCLKSLGGVPKILVPDNLKSAVTKTDRYEPEINLVLEDMANHYGCVVIPARPAKPKDKSLVEDQVKLVYRRVYAELRNETFYSLEELNKAVSEKMQAHNRKRMQQHPYSREEQFLAIEKPALHPLPPTDFQICAYTRLKVGTNGCVYLGRDKHYYSVPYCHIGQDVKVIYTRTLVKVFLQGECIATHKRSRIPGKYTLVNEHLASHSQAYRERSPSYYIRKGQYLMEELGQVIEYMFTTATVPVETFYRGCEGLLHLCKSTDPILFKRACQTALLYRRYQYAFVSQLVKSKCIGMELVTSEMEIIPPIHSNIRGKNEFK